MNLSSLRERGVSYWESVMPNRFRNVFTTADQVLIVISGLIIALVLVVLPLGFMFYFSFSANYPITDEGYIFTINNYVELFSDESLFIDITLESLFFALGSTFLALVIGLVAALLEIKYLDGSKFRYFMLIPYGIPSVVSVTGWILLLGQGGLINKFVQTIFGLQNPPFDIFTRWGMIYVEALHVAPIAFLLLSPAIRSIPAAIDEAGLTAGASRRTVYRKVILPLLGPSILSVSIFLFARQISVVTVPSILGLPKQIFTWGSAIPFLFLYGESLNYSLAFSFAVLITILSGFLMVFYYRSISRAEKFTTITGEGSADPKVYNIGRVKKFLAKSFFSGYLVLAAFLPLFIIAWDSILPTFTFQLDVSTYTFERYVNLFTGEATGVTNFTRTLTNTLILAITVPTVAMTISYLYSYSNQILNLPGSGFIAWLVSIPLTIPSIVISLAFLITFITTPLYGTVALVFVAMIAAEIPKGMRYTSPAIVRIGKGNVEMANISGYSELRTLKDIVIPLTSDDYVAGWMHIYVSSVREVTIPLLLYAAGSEVLGVELLYLLVRGVYKSASTIGVVLTILSVIPYLFLQYYRANNLDRDTQ